MNSHRLPAGIVSDKKPRLSSDNSNAEPEMSVDLSSPGDLNSDEHRSKESSPPPVDCLDFDSLLNSAVITFLASLYDSNSFTETQIQKVVNSHKQLLGGGFLAMLKDKVLGLLCEADVSKEEKEVVAQMFESCINMYDGLETEHQRKSEFENCGAFIRPESFYIKTVLDEQPSGVDTTVEQPSGVHATVTPIELTGQFIPLRKVLKGFFELPGVCEQVLSYMDELEKSDSSVISNVIQGEVWKTKIKPMFPGKIVLPLIAFHDDYEVNKEIGPHAGVHKLGATYIKVGVLPPEYQSKLENIFLFSLIHANDRKTAGNEKVFRKVISELKFLEETGVTVVLPQKTYQLFFALAVFTGDNLGLSGIFGLVECFIANFFCRICKERREIMQKQTRSNPSKIRNRDNYAEDLLKNDESETGIKEECVFHELRCFHFTENVYLDIMHDLDEGSWNYCLVAIINHLLDTNVVTLEKLNNLIQGFNYGSSEHGNKPTLITADHLKRNKLACTASEMRCLYRYFSLMVGHLVSERDPAWKLYLAGRKIIHIVTSPKVRKDEVPLLKVLIEEHHKLFLKLTKGHLYPKMHHMVHEPEVLLAIGPLEPVSVIRMEGKHKEGKDVSRSSYNRINLPRTIAKRHQMQLCFRLLSGRGFPLEVETSPVRVLSPKLIEGFVKFKEFLPATMLSEDWLTVTWATVYGTKYSFGAVVVLKLLNNEPVFGRIRCITLSQQGTAINFLLEALTIVRFDSHFFAYEVKFEDPVWYFVRQDKLENHEPAELRQLFNGKFYVALRHSI